MNRPHTSVEISLATPPGDKDQRLQHFADVNPDQYDDKLQCLASD